MKVFISWSGKSSQAVAAALRDWLPRVIQAVKPFMSADDIRKGSRWFAEIGSQLEDSNFGILCLTPDNLDSKWIHFEAGALSKRVDESSISALLVGVGFSQVEPPLSGFNHTMAEKDDVEKLVKAINERLGDNALAQDILKDTFEALWPKLDEKIEAAKKLIKQQKQTVAEPKPLRSNDELLKEVLEITRDLSKQMVKVQQSISEVNTSTQYIKVNTSNPFVYSNGMLGGLGHGKFPSTLDTSNVPSDFVGQGLLATLAPSNFGKLPNTNALVQAMLNSDSNPDKDKEKS